MLRFFITLLFIAFALQAHGQTTGQSRIKGPNHDILEDGQIARVMITINEGEIASAEWAKKKAKTQDVLTFAEQMKSGRYENMEASKKLAQQMNADLKDSDLSKSIRSDVARAEQHLRQVKKGSPDKIYNGQQIKMHEVALNTINGSLLPNVTNSPKCDRFVSVSF